MRRASDARKRPVRRRSPSWPAAARVVRGAEKVRRRGRRRRSGDGRAAVRRPSIGPAWLADAVGGGLAVPGMAGARNDGEIVAACVAAVRGLAAAKGIALPGGEPRTPADLAKRFHDFSPTVRDWSAAAVEELLGYFPEIEGDIRVDCVKPVTQDLGDGPDIFRLLGNEPCGVMERSTRAPRGCTSSSSATSVDSAATRVRWRSISQPVTQAGAATTRYRRHPTCQ